MLYWGKQHKGAMKMNKQGLISKVLPMSRTILIKQGEAEDKA